MEEENRVKKMLEGLTPEERKAKLDYWCPDLSGQLVIIDKDGTVLVDPRKGINLLKDEIRRESSTITKKRGNMEAHLRQILGGKVEPFSYKKAFPWLFEVRRAYKALGGIMDDFPSNLGDWDVFLDRPTAEKKLGFEGEVRIELDEEQHFNRYRHETLNAPFYSELPVFPINDYRHYCRCHEDTALRVGKRGGFWTNKSAEEQFGPAGPNGILDGDGAPRWKQRAFYDMVKDLASLVFNIPLARISVWDEVCLEDGTTENVRSILKLEPDRVSPQQVEALKGLIRSRLNTVIPCLNERKMNRDSHIEKMPYIALQEIVALDTMRTEDDIRRGDFVYFERKKKGEILMRLIPRGALLLALHKENRAIAVVSSKEAENTVPHAPLYEVDLDDIQEAEDGTMSLSMVYRPVKLTNNEMCRSIANLRAVLPRLPVCRAHPVPVSAPCCFSGFFFYYRDTGDMGQLLTFYKPGRILLERGFTDASSLRGGPAGKVRFLIASREGADMEAEEPDGTGLVTLMAEARFLVIDDYAPDVKARQITLLHVPARAILRQFLASIDTEAIESLRAAARSDFDALRKLSPIHISQSPEWLDRVSAPLGFDSHGRLVLDAWHPIDKQPGMDSHEE